MITFNKDFIDMRLFDDNTTSLDIPPPNKEVTSYGILNIPEPELPPKIPLTNNIKFASWVPDEDIETIKADKEMPKITALFYGREDSKPHYICLRKIQSNAKKAFDDGLYDIKALSRIGPNLEYGIREGMCNSSDIFSLHSFSILSIFATLHERNVYQSNSPKVKSNSSKILRAIKQLEKQSEILFELLGEKNLEFSALDLLPLFKTLNSTVYTLSEKQQISMRPFNFYANGYIDHVSAHEAIRDFYSQVKYLAITDKKELKMSGRTPSPRVYIIRRVTFELLNRFSQGSVEFALCCIKATNFHFLVSHIAGLLIYGTPLELVNARAEVETAINIWRDDSFPDYPSLL